MVSLAKTERFELRLDAGLLDNVDEWRGRQADVPSRAEAVRRLIEAGLATPKEREIGFSDGEKLITLMLCEIAKHLKMNGEIDPHFVASAIQRGSLWGLGWEYTGVFHGHEDSPATRTEVVRLLDMWSSIERGYSKLLKKDKDRVAIEAEPYGKHVVFQGFDGNSESGHLGIAGFLINELARFSEFKGRDLTSHAPLLDGYRRMFNVFARIRNELIGQELNASQIIEILKAKGHSAAPKE